MKQREQEIFVNRGCKGRVQVQYDFMDWATAAAQIDLLLRGLLAARNLFFFFCVFFINTVGAMETVRPSGPAGSSHATR